MEPHDTFSFRSVQYLAICQKWAVALENFDAESQFFHFLFEDYATRYLSSYFATKLRELEGGLTKLDKESCLLKKELKGQLMILEAMVDGMIKENSDYVDRRQIGLEKKLNSFNHTFSQIKNDLFKVVGSANESHQRFSSPCIEKLV